MKKLVQVLVSRHYIGEVDPPETTPAETATQPDEQHDQRYAVCMH